MPGIGAVIGQALKRAGKKAGAEGKSGRLPQTGSDTPIVGPYRETPVRPAAETVDWIDDALSAAHTELESQTPKRRPNAGRVRQFPFWLKSDRALSLEPIPTANGFNTKIIRKLGDGKKATGPHILKLLRKNGVSDEELYYTGLQQYLEAHPEYITAADAKRFLDENQPAITQSILGRALETGAIDPYSMDPVDQFNLDLISAYLEETDRNMTTLDDAVSAGETQEKMLLSGLGESGSPSNTGALGLFGEEAILGGLPPEAALRNLESNRTQLGALHDERVALTEELTNLKAETEVPPARDRQPADAMERNYAMGKHGHDTRTDEYREGVVSFDRPKVDGGTTQAQPQLHRRWWNDPFYLYHWRQATRYDPITGEQITLGLESQSDIGIQEYNFGGITTPGGLAALQTKRTELRDKGFDANDWEPLDTYKQRNQLVNATLRNSNPQNYTNPGPRNVWNTSFARHKDTGAIIPTGGTLPEISVNYAGARDKDGKMTYHEAPGRDAGVQARFDEWVTSAEQNSSFGQTAQRALDQHMANLELQYSQRPSPAPGTTMPTTGKKSKAGVKPGEQYAKGVLEAAAVEGSDYAAFMLGMAQNRMWTSPTNNVGQPVDNIWSGRAWDPEGGGYPNGIEHPYNHIRKKLLRLDQDGNTNNPRNVIQESVLDGTPYGSASRPQEKKFTISHYDTDEDLSFKVWDANNNVVWGDYIRTLPRDNSVKDAVRRKMVEDSNLREALSDEDLALMDFPEVDRLLADQGTPKLKTFSVTNDVWKIRLPDGTFARNLSDSADLEFDLRSGARRHRIDNGMGGVEETHQVTQDERRWVLEDRDGNIVGDNGGVGFQNERGAYNYGVRRRVTDVSRLSGDQLSVKRNLDADALARFNEAKELYIAENPAVSQQVESIFDEFYGPQSDYTGRLYDETFIPQIIKYLGELENEMGVPKGTLELVYRPMNQGGYTLDFPMVKMTPELRNHILENGQSFFGAIPPGLGIEGLAGGLAGGLEGIAGGLAGLAGGAGGAGALSLLGGDSGAFMPDVMNSAAGFPAEDLSSPLDEFLKTGGTGALDDEARKRRNEGREHFREGALDDEGRAALRERLDIGAAQTDAFRGLFEKDEGRAALRERIDIGAAQTDGYRGLGDVGLVMGSEYANMTRAGLGALAVMTPGDRSPMEAYNHYAENPLINYTPGTISGMETLRAMGEIMEPIEMWKMDKAEEWANALVDDPAAHANWYVYDDPLVQAKRKVFQDRVRAAVATGIYTAASTIL